MSNELEKYIQENMDELDVEKPDPAVLGRILEAMETNRKDKVVGSVIPLRLLKWAVACLLVIAGSMAAWRFKERRLAIEVVKVNAPQRRQLQQPGGNPAVQVIAGIASEHMVVRKKAFAHKAKAKRSVLFAALCDMHSAAGRINAIKVVSMLKNTNNDVVDSLEQILNNDPNSNVRLASLDVLAQFYKNPYVRKKLTAALKMQRDPVVQIDLISLLIRMRELGVLSELEEMVNDAKITVEVRDISYSGILQLRSE